MSMILDVLVLTTIAICIFVYTKRGLIKSVLGFCGCFIAMIAATLTKPLLMPMVSPLVEKILQGATHGKLSAILNTELTVHTIAGAISFVLLFVLYIVAIRLITFLLDRFCRLPVLKQANRLLGFAIGVVIGLLYAQLLSVFLFTFSELLLSVQNVITPEAYERSVVAKWMFEHNLFRLLIDLL